ncbi:hypothetical protein P7D22_07160 [Lichenihabitans sp. Uapishka_5]|uniref:hypothetical protein n=1 Tax=Lichenihabitans sp. Uapishka_5 TaxID=3037302 RepID=UPI0029E7D457|nr:hypothetical protein [Lichenihabitans sp. Uapishka_5]MDX7950957.1 hypothetical protein [Lichenihabitans sp. Uapishka_5]
MLRQIGTVVDVIRSMRINLLAGISLAAATTFTSAQALTITSTGSTTASIFSRDAIAQFERNGYTTDVIRTDDGDLGSHAATQASPIVDSTAAVTTVAPQSDGQSETSTPSSRSLAVALQSSSLGSDSNGPSTLVTGGNGGQGSTTVGTVPLPPSLPLFGAALLVVAALGRSRRKRTA